MIILNILTCEIQRAEASALALFVKKVNTKLIEYRDKGLGSHIKWLQSSGARGDFEITTLTAIIYSENSNNVE